MSAYKAIKCIYAVLLLLLNNKLLLAESIHEQNEFLRFSENNIWDDAITPEQREALDCLTDSKLCKNRSQSHEPKRQSPTGDQLTQQCYTSCQLQKGNCYSICGFRSNNSYSGFGGCQSECEVQFSNCTLNCSNRFNR